MPLTPGTNFGPYRITAKIGEGGMGEVYQARDTTLDRDVALKVLSEAFTSDPDRLARFEREAKVLASLNQPNIGSIYGLEEADGVKALVLELVEGPTLADRIQGGPIPLGEVLPIARQIAEALKAAHEAGIVHRDLKPANIKLRKDGTVKVLDFGLAKALGTTLAGDPSQSPTVTAAATKIGVIMGTPAYMSPEQASGQPADMRSDMWSFGVVLFEMLTGQPLFTGKTVAHVMAKVLDRDADLTGLPATVPAPLRRLLRRCLEREQRRRLRDVGEALSCLEDTATPPAEDSSEEARDALVTRPAGWRQALALAAAALVVGVIGIAVWTQTRPPPAALQVTRSAILLPLGVSVGPTNHYRIALSPSGTDLVFAGNDQLYLRALDQMVAKPLAGTDGASEPFFSPDGKWLAFWADGELKKVSLMGGLPVTICETAEPFGASWADDDTILFNEFQVGIWRVPGAGGTPDLIVPVGDAGGGFPHPQLLPGGEWILFWEVPSRKVVIQSLVTGERQVLIENAPDVRYLPSGHLAFVRDGTLLVVPFDVKRLAVTGRPVPLISGVSQANNGVALWAYSDDGTLAYVSGGEATQALVWVDQEGGTEVLPLPSRRYHGPRVSPDGRQIAVMVWEDGSRDLWIYDAISSRGLQLTHGFEVRAVAWTPDSSRIVFMSFRDSVGNIYSVPADGGGQPELVLASSTGDAPSSVAPDGRMVAFTRLPDGVGASRSEIWEVAINGDEPARPLVRGGEFRLESGQYSPDGNWLAYQSNQSGVMEVYVQPYPGPGPALPISIGGGSGVTWSVDGSRLFYRLGDRMIAALFDPNARARSSSPTTLFSLPFYYREGTTVRQYDVAPDGRFLMMKPFGRADDDAASPPQINLVLNWFEELSARVPVP